MGVKAYLVRLMPFAAMVMVECLQVGLTTLGKAAMSNGMSPFVLLVYSNAIATLILLPSSFIFQRTNRPPLTFSLLSKFFVLGFIGITVMQNCVLAGINYSNPTFGSAMSNLIPAFTFLLAVIFRMEKLDFKSLTNQIKVMGMLVSISGALIVTLYKGPPIGSLPSQALPLSYKVSLQSQASASNMLTSANNWVIGGLFLAIATLSAAIWNISQVPILKGYASEITIVAFCCLFGTIQCSIVSLIAEKGNTDVWKLRPDIGLISVIYTAVCGNGVTLCVQAWCIHTKGPVFVATFKPLGIAIAAFTGIIFLGDVLHVGSVIGATVIVIGFYGVIWAQSEEWEIASGKDDRFASSSQNTPLLQDHKAVQTSIIHIETDDAHSTIG